MLNLSKLIYMEELSLPTKGLKFQTSESQKEIWLSCVIGGEDANRAFNLSMSIEFKGYLDYMSLKKALNEIFERHEILKCTFSSDGQYINKGAQPLQIEVVPLYDLDPKIQETEISRILEEQVLLVFDLEAGPLTKFTFIQKSPEENILVFTAHHLICDGWSAGVFLRELSQLYNSFYEGYGLKLATPPTYWEYADFEGNFLISTQFERNLNFWKKEIGSNPVSLRLVTDFERTENRSFHGRRYDQNIGFEMGKRLKQLSKNLGVSFFNLMLSSFELLMAKTANQKQFIIGLPAAGQVISEKYNLIGHCVNFLSLPVTVDLDLSFSDYVKIRKGKLSEVLDHQQLTFGTLLKELKISRKANEVPIVPVVFNVDLGMDDDVEFVGLDVSIRTNPRKFENFEVFLNLFECKSSLVFEWSYNPDLYTEATVENWSKDLNKFLLEVLDQPNALLRDLLAPENEQEGHQLPIEYEEIPDFIPIVDLIERSVKLYADKVAVIFKDSPLTYSKLNSLSNKMARILQGQGVKKGDRIGLVMDRSEKMIVSIFAILKAGAAYLPIDTDYPIARINFTLADAETKLAIIDKKNFDKFKGSFELMIYEDALANSKTVDDSNLGILLTENDPAYIIYTSGSTGQPKGVILDHGNLHSFLQNVSAQPGIDNKDVLLAFTSNSFDISILELLLPYVHGAQSFLLDNFERRDPKRILDVIQKNQITFMFATPSHWKMLLDGGWKYSFPKLNIISGGESLEIHLADKLLDKCKCLWNIYGPTETTVFSTIKQIATKGESLSIGKPIIGTNIYILDDRGKPVPTGEIGEMYISGQGVGQGYINRSDLNKEKFLTDPFIKKPNVRMFRTGDLGKYDQNGDLYCLGRIDQQVKFRGFRIELNEISNKLLAMDGVANAVVDVKEVHGEKSLVAYLIPQKSETYAVNEENNEQDQKEIEKDGQREDLDSAKSNGIVDQEHVELDISQIRKGLYDSLPSFMVPTYFVPLKEFPLSQNGKVVRQDLPLPNPIQSEYHDNEQSRDELSPIEQVVSEIWSKALNLNNIGLNDDFFELGGHSLLAVKVMSQIDAKLGVRIPIATLFHYPTIASLAQKLAEEDKSKEWSSIVPLKTTGSKKPLFIVHGAGLNVMPFQSLANVIDGDQPLYGIQSKGLNGVDKPFDCIIEMADFYVQQLLEVQPKGEIELAGYSFGGVLAFEMARILKEKYHIELDKVIMIEAFAHQNKHYKNGLHRILSKTEVFWKKRFFNFKILLKNPKIYKEEKLHYYYQNVVNLTKSIFGIKEKEIEDSLMKTIKSIEAFNELARKKHTIKPLDIKVALLKTKDQYHWVEDFETYGWKGYSREVVSEIIQGNHDMIFEPENIQILATGLEKIILK